MDALSGATAFATLVGLIGQFRSVHKDGEAASVDAFRTWLSAQHHEELAALLTANSKTTVAVKALLHKNHEELKAKVDLLSDALVGLVEGIEDLKQLHSDLIQVRATDGVGGAGGSGVIHGNGGTIVGGRGGDGGSHGTGGAGGGGVIHGDGGTIVGGDGGSAGTWDGRGGRGAKGPTETYGVSTSLWGYGRGGAGANDPEYDRRVSVLSEIRSEYTERFPGDAPYIHAGIDFVPIGWINQRLVERGEEWAVSQSDAGRILMPALTNFQT